jgi:hypothetical protein
MGNFHHAAALPFLAEYYQRRFDYGPMPVPPTFYHPVVQVSPTGLSSIHPLRSFSTPSLSSATTLLVNSNHSSSAFGPLIPIVRQHSVDTASTSVLYNNRDLSARRSIEDDDADIDIESLPSPSKLK